MKEDLLQHAKDILENDFNNNINTINNDINIFEHSLYDLLKKQKIQKQHFLKQILLK